MYNIITAKPSDSIALTELAIQSESYWGYDEVFLKEFAKQYNVTEDYIRDNPVYMLYTQDSIIGFYGMLLSGEEKSLEYLFVKPEYIGQGYGKILWNHMIKTCYEEGIKEFVIVTSPQAKEFYTRLGAKYIGEVESIIIKGRKIPKLIYIL
ncbi:MAG: GNAT family N-acetyltransferase [Clostridiales bacterium]|nr:GNAT family N-acetyltransferase [Clostridiales bacterium]